MKKNRACYMLGLAVVAIVWFAAVDIPREVSENPLMKPAEAFELIQKNKGHPQFVVLDVRTPEEFNTGHLEGAINVNFNGSAFKEEIGRLDREKTYLVYCRTGRRSGEAVRIMRDLGFKRLLQFEGDIVRWQAEKLPLVFTKPSTSGWRTRIGSTDPGKAVLVNRRPRSQNLG